jgi:hypothetical protein
LKAKNRKEYGELSAEEQGQQELLWRKTQSNVSDLNCCFSLFFIVLGLH